jgi:cytoskeletal protein RodZ
MKRLALLFSIIVIGLGALMFAQASQSREQAAQATAQATPNVQQPTITPQKGQSAAQQQQDLAECYEIAKSKTGVDPRALGAITAGKFDSIPGMPNSSKTETSTATATPQEGASGAKNAMLDKFQLANQGCMQAKGYIVKSPAPSAPSPKQ